MVIRARHAALRERILHDGGPMVRLHVHGVLRDPRASAHIVDAILDDLMALVSEVPHPSRLMWVAEICVLPYVARP
jgi:hypothetical protein